MFIRQIRLKNYRCYKEATIKLGLDLKSGKNINLATGEIKAGKTTLFNAVGWCLYGIETQFLLKTKSEIKDEKTIPNEKSYEGDKSIVEVDIDIKIPENSSIESLSIRRVCTYHKGSTRPSSTDFSIHAFYGGEPLRITNYEKFLEQFLPQDLIHFYLFDGEYLQHTAANTNLKIRDGLKKLFNIEKVEKASGMIGELVEDWYKQSSKMPKQSSRMIEIDSNIASLLERKRNEEVRIKDEENTKAQLTSERDRLQEELSKLQVFQEAVTKFNSLEEKEKEIEQQLRENMKFYYTSILKNTYLINGKKTLQLVNEISEKEPKAKILPADVRHKFLAHLLDRKRCVCGNPIKKESSEEKAVISELAVAQSEERYDFLVDLTYKISNILESIDSTLEEIRRKEKDIMDLGVKRKSIITEKNEIQKQLPKGKIDASVYASNLNKFTALSNDINDADKNILTFRNNILNFDFEIERLKQEREKILDKTEEADILNRNIDIGNYLKKIFDRFNKEILNNIALELETEINKLTAQNKKISELDVKITTNNNNIDFKFVEKGSARHYLSGGQNQLFGIIIMAAFVRIMDKRGRDRLPFVFMDNPFSSIDKDSLEIASTNLSDLFRNAQVILFTTNDKFDKVYTASKESIFTAMTLINDGTNVKPNILDT